MDTQRIPYQAGVLLGWVQLSVGVPKIISFFCPFFKPLKMPFKFTCTPTLKEPPLKQQNNLKPQNIMLTIKNIQLFFSQSKQFVCNFNKKGIFPGRRRNCNVSWLTCCSDTKSFCSGTLGSLSNDNGDSCKNVKNLHI